MKKIIIGILICLLSACNNSSNVDYYEQGIKLFEEGNYEEAILSFEEVIKIDKRNVDAYLKLAEVYVTIGEYDSAAEILIQGSYSVDNEEENKKLMNELANIKKAVISLIVNINESYEITSFSSLEKYIHLVEDVWRNHCNEEGEISCLVHRNENMYTQFIFANPNQNSKEFVITTHKNDEYIPTIVGLQKPAPDITRIEMNSSIMDGNYREIFDLSLSILENPSGKQLTTITFEINQHNMMLDFKFDENNFLIDCTVYDISNFPEAIIIEFYEFSSVIHERFLSALMHINNNIPSFFNSLINQQEAIGIDFIYYVNLHEIERMIQELILYN